MDLSSSIIFVNLCLLQIKIGHTHIHYNNIFFRIVKPKYLITFLLVAFFSINSNCQSFSDFFTDTSKTDSLNTLILDIENVNFFKNNEYFNPYVEGYTLIGYWLKPQVVFNAGERLSFNAGFHAQKYSGVDGFSQFRPLFSVRFLTGKNSKLVFGNLNSSLQHNLTDYLLNQEYYLTQNCQSGLEFIYQGSAFKTDTWIDWRQFIFKDSPFPEILLFGSSNSLQLFKKPKSSLFLQLSAVASHVGGQIDASSTNVQTIINSQSGFDYFIKTERQFLNSMRLFSHYYTSLDQSPTKSLKYLYGYGINSGLEFSSDYFDIRFEHWFGEYYFSKFGNQMFNSMNIEFPRITEDKRAFVNTHLFLKYTRVKFMRIGLGVNLFYDLYNQHLDYSMGFYLKTDLKFKLIE